MKKLTSLLLALVMALSLCATAFAGSAAETAVLRLTGDAADEVVNLKDGQRVSAGRDVAVRLNVQSDPAAAEYTVALDGQTVEVDHSTSQYHFYYLPAAQLSGVSTLSVSTQADVGTDAFPIATADDLKDFRDEVNSGSHELNAILTADIDLQNEEWEPIGSNKKRYAGIFDGGGHTISGLNITSGSNNGLFKMTSGATIQNLTISDSTISFGDSATYCGAFVGLVKGDTTLINCHTTDTVTISGGAVGGLVGGTNRNDPDVVVTLERCSNAATINGNASITQNGVGGLIGSLSNGAVITDCFNTGAVTNSATSDSATVGGLLGSGYIYDTAVSSYNTPLTLTNVYNTGIVSAGGSGTSYVGGLVGNSDGGFNITNAYGTMTVKVGDAYGGIIVGTVKNDVSVSNIYSEVIQGKTTDCKVYLNDSIGKMGAVKDNKLWAHSEMKDPSNLLAKLGDGFAEDTGNINNGYPVLAWQNAVSSGAVELTVTAGSQTQTVQLPSDGNTTPASPTKVEVAFDNPGENAVMDRIYFTDLPESVSLGTTMSNTGVLSNELTKLDAGYTGESLYFYKTPKALSASVKAVWTDGEGAKHYYTITITRAAQSGLALGVTASVYDANPCGAGASNGYNADGFLKTMAAMYMGVKTYYTAQAVYVDGTVQKQGNSEICALPAWDDLKEKSNGLYYYEEGSGPYATDYAYFARMGRYWLPVTYTSNAGTATGFVPVQARLGTTDNVDYYIGKAQAVDMTSAPEEAQNMLTTAISTVESNKSLFNNYSLTRNESGQYETVSSTGYSGIYYRDFFGYKPYAESLYEKDINAIMDLTAIFSGDDATLANYQWQAYQKIMTMQGGIHRFIDIQSLADRDTYQNIRQAKWDLLQATDLEGVNAILTNLNLDTIAAEPEVMLGDINGDGEITIIDAGLIVQHVNTIKALSEAQLAAADVNKDGAVTIIDAGIVVQYVNKIRSSLN